MCLKSPDINAIKLLLNTIYANEDIIKRQPIGLLDWHRILKRWFKHSKTYQKTNKVELSNGATLLKLDDVQLIDIKILYIMIISLKIILPNDIRFVYNFSIKRWFNGK